MHVKELFAPVKEASRRKLKPASHFLSKAKFNRLALNVKIKINSVPI